MSTNAAVDNRHITEPVLRDVPYSIGELKYKIIGQSRREIRWFNKEAPAEEKVEQGEQLTSTPHKARWDFRKWNLRKYVSILTTGAGLFSDGYINTSISTVSACLSRVYKDEYVNSNAMQNVSSIAFAGTVAGQLFFGWFADYHSRKVSMIAGTTIIIVFSILCAGAWGVGTTSTHAGGLFQAITAYRFFLGLGIGGEYSSGSPAAAEAANSLPAGKRNRYFISFTNLMLDVGGIVASFTALVVLWICRTSNLNTVWRVTLGIGAIPPMSLFILRLFYKESAEFQKHKFNRCMPYWRIIKFYWFRILTTSVIWFLYDFSSYAFTTYSTIIIQLVMGENASMYKSFGWNVVFSLFYVPGSILGAICADWLGPRITLTVGLIVQAIFGYAIAGALDSLKKHIAGFVVIYGIFISCGEFGPGDNIGLLCANIVAAPVRGHLYGWSAAIGKVGAFVGTYVFPDIIKDAGGSKTTSGIQAPYWCASSLCIFSALVGFFCLPATDQQQALDENAKFFEYLKSTGYDVSLLGDHSFQDSSFEEASITVESSSGKEVEIKEVIEIKEGGDVKDDGDIKIHNNQVS